MAMSDLRLRAVRSRPRTNLAAPIDPFVGRRSALDAIQALIDRGARLITLLGPPGIGKTRLALEFARARVDGSHPLGGVWAVELAHARSLSDLCANLGPLVGVGIAARSDERDVADAIGTALGEAGPLLLVLDDFEHLVPAAADVVSRWCAVASEAIVVVTSRERLGCSGEHVVELDALDLPQVSERDPVRLCETEAVALFAERARAAGAELDERPELWSSIARLVRALDGIPLAIEIAAARSRLLSPSELCVRLATRPASVLNGPAPKTSRHATLHSAIDWSWELLDRHERVALAQCSVFAGEFTLDGAEHVVQLGDDPSAPDVMDVLSALRDKSLIRRTPGADAGSSRFSMFASIREHARARGEALADEEATRARYRRYVLEATRDATATFWRSGSETSLAQLAAHKDHLAAAHRHLLADGEPEALSDRDARDLAELVLRLEPIVARDGAIEEWMRILAGGIAAAKRAGDDIARGRLLVVLGNAHGLRGDPQACLRDLGTARELGRKAGSAGIEAEALIYTGVRFRQMGRFDEALQIGREALDLLEGADLPRIEGIGLAVMGLLHSELGRPEQSRRFNLRAKQTLSRAGDIWAEALAIVNLAQLDHAAGELDHAERGYDAGIASFREVGDRRYEARYRVCRAGLALERGELESARVDLAMALEVLARMRSWHVEGLARATFGALEALGDDTEEAEAAFDEAEALLARTDAPAFRAALDVHRGQLDLARARAAKLRGDTELAARLESAARSRLDQSAHSASSEDVRVAVRLLEVALADRNVGDARARSSRPKLVVGDEGRWFRVGQSEAVDLGRRRAVRLVLDALATSRIESPGRALRWDALLELGWPNERVMPEAGATRVRVTISTLRRLGLASLIVTRDDGYLVDPRVPIARRAEARIEFRPK